MKLNEKQKCNKEREREKKRHRKIKDSTEAIKNMQSRRERKNLTIINTSKKKKSCNFGKINFRFEQK